MPSSQSPPLLCWSCVPPPPPQAPRGAIVKLPYQPCTYPPNKAGCTQCGWVHIHADAILVLHLLYDICGEVVPRTTTIAGLSICMLVFEKQETGSTLESEVRSPPPSKTPSPSPSHPYPSITPKLVVVQRCHYHTDVRHLRHRPFLPE